MPSRSSASKHPALIAESQRVQVKAISAHADVDPRTVERALREGVDVIRTRSVREAIVRAAIELGVDLPSPSHGGLVLKMG